MATSDCIGDPKTPLCAVETFLACSARKQIELCETVRAPGLGYADENSSTENLEYVVVAVHEISESEVTEELKTADWHRPGFVVVTVSVSGSPAMGWERGSAEWPKLDVVVRKAHDAWHIATWALWGFENFVEQKLPE